MLKRTCVFLLLLTLAALGAVACLNDGGEETDTETVLDGESDAIERATLPDLADEDAVLDEEQEFYQPGEQNLQCMGYETICSGPNQVPWMVGWECCNTACIIGPHPNQQSSGTGFCCHSYYMYQGPPKAKLYKCVKSTTCESFPPNWNTGPNLACGDNDDITCNSDPDHTAGRDNLCNTADDGCMSGASPGPDQTCGTADDVFP